MTLSSDQKKRLLALETLTHAVYVQDPLNPDSICFCDHCGKEGTMAELMDPKERCYGREGI